jgi:hypothetical protein
MMLRLLDLGHLKSLTALQEQVEIRKLVLLFKSVLRVCQAGKRAKRLKMPAIHN